MASECVKVMVRCRPMNSKEVARGKFFLFFGFIVTLDVFRQAVRASATLINRPTRWSSDPMKRKVLKKKFSLTTLSMVWTQRNGRCMTKQRFHWSSQCLGASTEQSLPTARQAVERLTLWLAWQIKKTRESFLTPSSTFMGALTTRLT